MEPHAPAMDPANSGSIVVPVCHLKSFRGGSEALTRYLEGADISSEGSIRCFLVPKRLSVGTRICVAPIDSPKLLLFVDGSLFSRPVVLPPAVAPPVSPPSPPKKKLSGRKRGAIPYSRPSAGALLPIAPRPSYPPTREFLSAPTTVPSQLPHYGGSLLYGGSLAASFTPRPIFPTIAPSRYTGSEIPTVLADPLAHLPEPFSTHVLLHPPSAAPSAPSLRPSSLYTSPPDSHVPSGIPLQLSPIIVGERRLVARSPVEETRRIADAAPATVPDISSFSPDPESSFYAGPDVFADLDASAVMERVGAIDPACFLGGLGLGLAGLNGNAGLPDM
eukprot:m.7498 g.7498  ORF g.7498 m.7498 type:complete len:333 (-) comp2197_c1_seq1:131-1129(-)